MIRTRIWRYFENWIVVRCQYVGMLWLVIGLIGFLYVKYVQPGVENRFLEKLREFADPALPGVLFVGALVITGLLGLSMRFVPSMWSERTADEVSGAATHFAAISGVVFAWQSALGGPQWSGLLVPLVMLIPAVLFCPFSPPPARAEDYEVKFIAPQENELVDGETLVRGTAKKEPPSGYEIWLVRRWGGFDHEFYPVDEIKLKKAQNGKYFEWAVRNATVGGLPGKGEIRKFEVWLVGPDGQNLFKLWDVWNEHYSTYRSDPRFKDVEMLSRAIEGQTKDMLKLADRIVIRK